MGCLKPATHDNLRNRGKIELNFVRKIVRGYIRSRPSSGFIIKFCNF